MFSVDRITYMLYGNGITVFYVSKWKVLDQHTLNL